MYPLGLAIIRGALCCCCSASRICWLMWQASSVRFFSLRSMRGICESTALTLIHTFHLHGKKKRSVARMYADLRESSPA